MLQGETLINLLISGAGVVALAKLLQNQYEQRIKDQAGLYDKIIASNEKRIDAQTGKIDSLLQSIGKLTDAALISAQTAANAHNHSAQAQGKE